VGRQPFGGWKRSTVGPAAKAGGPAYVASLCAWSDGATPDHRRRDRAERSYPEAWATLTRPADPSALVAERNELRSLPLPHVVLRMEHDARPTDAELCRLAAATVGVRLLVSSATDEPVAALIARMRAEPGTRIRVLGTVPDALRRAAVDAGMDLDDRVPVADGRIELRRWTREQAVSTTAHRHGAPIDRGAGSSTSAE